MNCSIWTLKPKATATYEQLHVALAWKLYCDDAKCTNDHWGKLSDVVKQQYLEKAIKYASSF